MNKFITFIYRFLGVFGLTYLINLRRLKPITYKEQFIMAYGGLRGAVGFSLVTILPDSEPLKNMFLTTTIIMIYFTVFIQGGTIKFLVDKLKITKKSNEAKSMSKDVNLKTIDHVMVMNYSLSYFRGSVIMV
jgi:NhaP-type Na+/H+ or K+/H+ antiporter